VVLFGGNHYSDRLPVGGWLVWDKTGGNKAHTLMADAEMAWHNLHRSVDVFHHLWLGAFRESEHKLRGVHPTQKPVALMRYIVDRWTQPGDLMLDPYMGSGPVARACLDLGRRYIGVEIEERYCQIAVERLAQGVLPL
jgi:DNA modification methylase